MSNVLVGILAGLVSAVLVATLTAGSPLGLLLAPLPILIAALGWSHRSGLVAAAVGGLAIGIVFRPEVGLVFLIGPALPAWWLAYLALLGRPRPDGSLEWYPLGRLLLWIAASAALLTLVIALPQGAWDYETYRAAARAMIEAAIRVYLQAPSDAPLPNVMAGVPRDELIDALATTIPFAYSALYALAFTLNLWLAAKIVAISERLPRPWPSIAQTRMPRSALLPTGAAVVAALLSGFVGVFGLALAGALAMAFALQGLALLHDVSRGRPGRTGLLVGAYILLAFIGHTFLPLLALAGLADTAIDLRRRFPPGGPGPRRTT
jgi:hypothetical protein